MKTVVSGVALAAILAFAMPAWAQGTDAQQSKAPQTDVSMPHAKKAHATRGMHAPKTSHKNAHRAAMRHHAGHHYATNAKSMHRTTTARAGGASPTDHMANRLNRAENQRLSGSSAPPMTGPNMAPPPAGSPNMAPMGAPNQPQPIQGQ